MTRQTWTAFVAAVVFVALAAMIAAIPAPFVSWSPGGARDTLGTIDGTPIISIADVDSYPTTGRLDLTTVSVTRADSHVTLPEAVLSYWLPARDAVPRDSVYDPGKSAEEVTSEDAELMVTAQDDAVVAALRAADQPVTEMPAIASVTVGGPSHTRLLPGDLVVSVDGRAVTDAEQVAEQVNRHTVGDTVDFVVLRDRVRQRVSVTTAASSTSSGAVIGVEVGVGYRYVPRISFDLGQEIGGPSAGLVFALAIYDKLTAGDLLAGRHVAGTGGIDPGGVVSSIGGLQEKIAAAEEAGATAFLVPAANCADVAGMDTDLTLIKVATLGNAIDALATLSTPGVRTAPSLLMTDEQEAGEPIEPDPGQVALMATLLELDRHVREAGWDQPPRLFALVATDELLATEPGLAEALGLRGSADGAPTDALTAVEQDEFEGGDLLEALAAVAWPPTVFGCAVSVERTFLPSGAEGDIPDDPAAAAAYVAEHPQRQDVRVVVGVDRAGHHYGVARLVSQPDELLAAEDLVPGLVSALAHTLI